ncbi:MAG: shikimate dehydrogenase [Deltaproteobacteria bacterium]|nr:shikimate dehydrogenase [Deltaproteobacteria bacterium]MBI4373770.1 shikimate dehydrogenase [Deltaproteobacteria bacterium]
MTVKIFGILGDPIQHSLSPEMFGFYFRKKRLPCLYLRFHVGKEGLGRFVEKCRGWGLAGFNVTIPHKETILPFLDQIDPTARRLGAVNTVSIRGDRLIGHNTDATGYLSSLRNETRFRPRGKSVLILGAGGACRAILYALCQQGTKKIFLANRTRLRAVALARRFKKIFPKVKILAIPLTVQRLSPIFPKIDLLINTAAVGLGGTRHKQLPPLRLLPRQAIVSDIIYRPLKTALLKEAKMGRLRTHGGAGMLLHQAVLAYRIWTGKRPDLKIMRKGLLDALKED